MDKNELRTFVENALASAKYCRCEEASKMALIFPLLNLLGYETSDPQTVIPEYGANDNTRADLAIKDNGNLLAIIEAKAYDVQLKNHVEQLRRYFDALHPSIGVLTNGMQYLFYTSSDLSKMDSDPFFSFTLDSFSEVDASVVCLFSAENIRKNGAVAAVSEAQVLLWSFQWFSQQKDHPDSDLVKLILAKCRKPSATKNAVEVYAPFVSQAFGDLLSSSTAERIAEPRADEAPSVPEAFPEEIAAYHLIRDVLAEWAGIVPSRVSFEPHKSFCSVLVDKSVWLCRLLLRYKNNKQIWMHCDRDGSPNGWEDTSKYKFQFRSEEDLRKEKDWILLTLKVLGKYDSP